MDMRDFRQDTWPRIWLMDPVRSRIILIYNLNLNYMDMSVNILLDNNEKLNFKCIIKYWIFKFN